MRWLRAALLVWAASIACRFSLNGIDAVGDMATRPGDGGGGGGDMPACACFTGCSATNPSTCQSLQPTGPVTAGDYGMSGLGAINVAANITVNTDNGMIMGMPGAVMRPGMPGVVGGIGFHVVTQSGGPGVGIFSVASLKIASGVKVTVTGMNAFALASAGAVEIDGTIDASCSGPAMSGPGGSTGGMSSHDGSGSGAGKSGAGGGGGNAAGGGGGAAYGDSGGSGSLITGATANGGMPWGDLTATKFVLVGGSGGGGGGGA
ncbi:MAG TPA: hypothetical protein VGL86_12560, partial [Polyangia bacterium]